MTNSDKQSDPSLEDMLEDRFVIEWAGRNLTDAPGMWYVRVVDMDSAILPKPRIKATGSSIASAVRRAVASAKGEG